ncbi:DUF4249 family protein [Flagellimonas sp. 389]|uniref:DUF4249 family protein n=1 Tax=Flagellimonas sp. 389 TaxID=2835862 RepID=UPI001BD2376C|nr:DUF4249 family protein [Flagellimonas sp. 389]MBS9463468.1 DUF4249 family protein [Flagellimonas sp. 389]
MIGSDYIFLENEHGKYISAAPFGARQGIDYSLSIVTAKGSSFSAGPISIDSDAELESLRAVKATAENGEDGVAILASGSDLQGDARFYRYDYEETYKIVSFSNPIFDLVVVSENPPILKKVPRTTEDNICYQSKISNSIVITTTENLLESQVKDFQIRFLPKNAFELRTRYSILVNQYVQSQTAHTFYEDLQEFSNIRTVFAQTQPGFLKGNVISDNNDKIRVLGLFEVAQVSSKRIFIEYDDVFSDNDPPDYIIDCPLLEYDPNNPDLGIFDLIKSGEYRYRGERPKGLTPEPEEPFYLISLKGCVDCTIYGTNIKPDFWED